MKHNEKVRQIAEKYAKKMADGGNVEQVAIADLQQDNIGKDKAEYNLENEPDHKPRNQGKPVKVGRHVKTGALHLLDGYHRVAAATKAGQSHITAEVIPTEGKYHKDPKKHWDAIFQHKPVKKMAEGGELPAFNETQPVTPDEPTAQSLTGQPRGEQLPSFQETKPIEQTAPEQAALPEFHETVDTAKYETPTQEIMTGLEGAAHGLTGGLSDLAMHGARQLAEQYTDNPDAWVPSDADRAARRAANPGIYNTADAGAMVAGILTGTGAPGLIMKGSKFLTPVGVSVLGKVGAAAMSSAIAGMGFQTLDEVSKGLLGEGDQQAPVATALAHIGTSGLLNGLVGGTFNVAGQAGGAGLKAIENAKLGDRAKNILAGIGMAQDAQKAGVPYEEAEAWIKRNLSPDMDYNTYKHGIEFAYNGLKNLVLGAAEKTAIGTGGSMGFKVAGPAGGVAGMKAAEKYAMPIIEKILQKPIIGVNKAVIPTVMYALSKGETSGLLNAMNYATAASKGSAAVNKGIESLFQTGIHHAIKDNVEREKEQLREYLDNGGVEREMRNTQQQPQGYAEGGPIMPGPGQSMSQGTAGTLDNLYPAQMMLMNAAKGRISNYLMSLKPQNEFKGLPFDSQPNTDLAEQDFEEALNIAVQPLSIIKPVKNGTIQASQVKHFTSMYPELHQYMSQGLTQKIMEAQMAKEKIPYATRQGIALFMGAALDSTMVPQSIQAIQGVFQQTKPQPPQGATPTQKPKSKGAVGKLGKSNASYQTTTQTAEKDRSARD